MNVVHRQGRSVFAVNIEFVAKKDGMKATALRDTAKVIGYNLFGENSMTEPSDATVSVPQAEFLRRLNIAMFGIGITEIAILFVVLLVGLAMLGVLFAVVYFAVRAGTRKGTDQDRTSDH